MKRMLRNGRLTRTLAIIACGTTMQINACNGVIGTTFRSAASESLETGVLSLVTGVVEGVFAVVNPTEDAETR